MQKKKKANANQVRSQNRTKNILRFFVYFEFFCSGRRIRKKSSKKPLTLMVTKGISCILQAGLSWKMVRKNWQKYRNGFYNFNINKLAKTTMKELMKNPNVIKNEKKIEGIIYNAKEFKKIKKECGSFSDFLKSLKQMKDREVFMLLSK
jgi:3-methyladenine DNA glycosylase Tag